MNRVFICLNVVICVHVCSDTSSHGINTPLSNCKFCTGRFLSKERKVDEFILGSWVEATEVVPWTSRLPFGDPNR